VQRADELESEEHHDDRGVGQLDSVVEVRETELAGPAYSLLVQLRACASQHLRRGVQADEGHLRPLAEQPVQREEGRPGRAPEVVHDPAGLGEVGRELRHHALDLRVERHGAVEHVVEDGGGLRAEVEVVHARQRLREELVDELADLVGVLHREEDLRLSRTRGDLVAA
jgi:hypothetical protein